MRLVTRKGSRRSFVAQLLGMTAPEVVEGGRGGYAAREIDSFLSLCAGNGGDPGNHGIAKINNLCDFQSPLVLCPDTKADASRA